MTASSAPTPASPTIERLRRYEVFGPAIVAGILATLDFVRSWSPPAVLQRNGNITVTLKPLFERFAYSDLYFEYNSHQLFSHPVPYLDKGIEYPVLTGLYMTLSAFATRTVRGYFVLSCIGLIICVVGTAVVLFRHSRRAGWLFAVCPLLLVYSVLNWDIFAIFLMVLGWSAYRRDRFGLAGTLLALATWAKLYPAFLALFLFAEMLRLRREGARSAEDLRSFLRGGVLTTLLVNVPFAILSPRNWGDFFGFNAGRKDSSGILFWFRILTHVPEAFVDIVLLSIVVAFIAIGLRSVANGYPAVSAAAAVFGGFLVIQKVYSPQYTLWMLVFALIAGWDLWAIALITMVGLIDYVNSYTILALVFEKSRASPTWYFWHIFPLGRDFRDVGLMTAILGTLATRRFGTMTNTLGHGIPTLPSPSRHATPTRENYDGHTVAVPEHVATVGPPQAPPRRPWN